MNKKGIYNGWSLESECRLSWTKQLNKIPYIN